MQTAFNSGFRAIQPSFEQAGSFSQANNRSLAQMTNQDHFVRFGTAQTADFDATTAFAEYFEAARRTVAEERLGMLIDALEKLISVEAPDELYDEILRSPFAPEDEPAVDAAFTHAKKVPILKKLASTYNDEQVLAMAEYCRNQYNRARANALLRRYFILSRLEHGFNGKFILACLGIRVPRPSFEPSTPPEERSRAREEEYQGLLQLFSDYPLSIAQQ